MSKQSHSHDDQPEALRLAHNLRTGRLGYEETLLPAAHTLCRLHADNQNFRTGYAAARLEIASLQARLIKVNDQHRKWFAHAQELEAQLKLRVQEVGAMAKENRSRAILELEDRIAHLANNLNTQKQARAHAEFTSECYEKDLSAIAAAVPAEKYPDSKDWRDGCTLERVQWLHSMYESSKAEVARLEAQLDAVGAGGVEPLRKGEQQPPAVDPDALAWSYIPGAWKSVVLTTNPVQAKLAIESGYKVTPLYDHPAPVRQPLTDDEIESLYGDSNFDVTGPYVIAFARAIEVAHGITNHETGCGACGDGCKSRGSCRFADESPELIAEPTEKTTGAVEVYRHKKTGSTYEVICNAARVTDSELLIVYRSIRTGERWVRPAVEFNDGRFEHVGVADDAKGGAA